MGESGNTIKAFNLTESSPTYHSLDQFPTGAFSSEKESDGGSNTLTSCANVVKRHVEINLIEDQNIELNKLFEMVREHNLTTYTLLAAMVYQV